MKKGVIHVLALVSLMLFTASGIHANPETPTKIAKNEIAVADYSACATCPDAMPTFTIEAQAYEYAYVPATVTPIVQTVLATPNTVVDFYATTVSGFKPNEIRNYLADSWKRRNSIVSIFSLHSKNSLIACNLCLDDLQYSWKFLRQTSNC